MNNNLKITERMHLLHEKILEGKPAGDVQIANYLQKLALLAIKAGINSQEWKEYMLCFASNEAQFQRLIGRDEDYNRTIWGFSTLAYLVADSTCGTTTDTFTGRFMTEDMLNALDYGLSAEEGPISGFEDQAAELKEFLFEEETVNV